MHDNSNFTQDNFIFIVTSQYLFFYWKQEEGLFILASLSKIQWAYTVLLTFTSLLPLLD